MGYAMHDMNQPADVGFFPPKLRLDEYNNEKEL